MAWGLATYKGHAHVLFFYSTERKKSKNKKEKTRSLFDAKSSKPEEQLMSGENMQFGFINEPEAGFQEEKKVML